MTAAIERVCTAARALADVDQRLKALNAKMDELFVARRAAREELATAVREMDGSLLPVKVDNDPA